MAEIKAKTKKIKKKDYIFAVGRRKTAIARVRLFSKSGDMIVNDKPIGEYFPSDVEKKLYLRPFDLTGTKGKVSISVRVVGSGKRAQLGAVTHGIARALCELNEADFRPKLKSAGLLTRDPRMKERRKVGKGGSARRSKQSPKR